MSAWNAVFLGIWAVFWLYWLLAAFSMKRGRTLWPREFGIRVVIVLLIFAAVHKGLFNHHSPTRSLMPRLLGLLLVLAGLGLAVWARRHIGRNWGGPMTQKREPELVTAGPYAWIRHPIYSGILLAGAGTAVANNWEELVIVVIVAIYFIYSATVEERFLTSQFPTAYPAYKARTKMLVPLIF